jgi:lipid-binding SYLF domain-containing protein
VKPRHFGLALLLVLLCIGASEPSTHQTGRTSELDKRIRKLTLKFKQMQIKPDKYIPADTLRDARAIVLLDRTKAGFLFAYQGGSGIAMVKDKTTKKWGPIGFVSANEASLGFQVGAQQSFIVILFMSDNAARVLAQPTFEFGGEARGTAGDQSAGVSGAVSSREQAMLVYDDRSGLFGGVALKGGAVSPDTDANLAYYNRALTMQDILFDGKVEPTTTATELAQAISDAENAPPPKPITTHKGRKFKAAQRPIKGAQMLMTSRTVATPTNSSAPKVESSVSGAESSAHLSESAVSTTSSVTSAGMALSPAPQSDVANEQLRLLLSDLSTNNQTSALNHLNAYLSAMTTAMQTADTATTLLVLQRLRQGQSPEAIDLLEARLDGSLIALGASLNAMPRAKRPPQSMELLRQVRSYREKYPRHTENPDIDKQVTQLLDLLSQ